MLPHAAEEFDTWARTVFGEARGECWEAQVGVAWVIKNRLLANHPGGRQAWWGDSIEAICRKPSQFSCWNPGDPNLKVLLAATLSDPAFRRAIGVVYGVDSGDLPDPTNGATNYFDTSITAPSWVAPMEPKGQIGRFKFYREAL